MPYVWHAPTYEQARRRLVPCYDEFYGAVAELVARTAPAESRILDLGAGTGILSRAISRRLSNGRFTLLDVSQEMLAEAGRRPPSEDCKFVVASLDAPLPPGPFDAVVSSLAIHHLTDDAKRSLYERAAATLSPGGLLLNADQIAAPASELDRLYRELHLDRARAEGSDEAEIAAAVERMQIDSNAPLDAQLAWMAAAGLENVDCFWRWFGFAVFGGWKPRLRHQ